MLIKTAAMVNSPSKRGMILGTSSGKSRALNPTDMERKMNQT